MQMVPSAALHAVITARHDVMPDAFATAAVWWCLTMMSQQTHHQASQAQSVSLRSHSSIKATMVLV